MYDLLAKLPNLFAIKDMGHGLIIGLLLMLVFSIKWQLAFLRTLPAVSMVCSLLALSLGLVYLIFPNYIDHAEPAVAVIGQIVAIGGQAYPSGADWQFNGLVYGPGLYLINALGTQLFDPVVGSKVPSVLSYILSLILLWWLLPTTFARSMLVLTYLFYEFSFWNRPEAHLLFLSVLGIALIERSRVMSITGMGLLAGIATSLKFTGFLFFVPMVFWLLLQKNNWYQLLLAVFLGISLAIFPYALPSFSYYNHVAYIQTLATQTLESSLFLSNLAYTVFSLIPIVWLWSSQRHVTSNKHLGFVILLDAFIELLICIAASKPGAGPHHLLPEIPIKIWLVHQLTLSNAVIVGRAQRFMGLVMFTLSIYYISYGFPKFLRIHYISKEYFHEQFQAKDELKNILENYPYPLMGVSDDLHANYSLSFFRPYAFSSAYSKYLDPVAYMEVNFTLGVDDHLFVERMQSCTYPSIVLPAHGIPFSLSSFYFKDKRQLFSNNLRSAFASKYKLVKHGRFYDVYTCSELKKEE